MYCYGEGAEDECTQRMMAMVHAAMFDAINSIEPRYRPYLAQLPAEPTTSKEAAAAAAAAALLTTIDAKTAGEMKAALAGYLASIADGAAKSDGVKLGEAVAAKVLEARVNDGCDAPDAYRPRTAPGVYVPTAITISSMWPTMNRANAPCHSLIAYCTATLISSAASSRKVSHQARPREAPRQNSVASRNAASREGGDPLGGSALGESRLAASNATYAFPMPAVHTVRTTITHVKRFMAEKWRYPTES